MSKALQRDLPADSGRFLRRFRTELIVGFLLGTLPLLLHSTRSSELHTMFQSLLASTPIIDHAICLLMAYSLVCLHKKLYRLKTDRMRERFEALYQVTAEVGTSFLTLLRTGLGAIVGFLIVAPFMEVEPIALKQWLANVALGVMTLVLWAWVSMLHDFLMPQPVRSQAKNHIRL